MHKNKKETYHQISSKINDNIRILFYSIGNIYIYTCASFIIDQ